jgi:hypothetical protein
MPKNTAPATNAEVRVHFSNSERSREALVALGAKGEKALHTVYRTDGSPLRGRIAPLAKEQFTRATGREVVDGLRAPAPSQTMKVSLPRDTGRPLSRTKTLAEVRAGARAEGVTVGERGRIPSAAAKAAGIHFAKAEGVLTVPTV